MPAPMPGCISRKGAATVATPTASAGPRLGCRTQAGPQIPIYTAANAIPVKIMRGPPGEC